MNKKGRKGESFSPSTFVWEMAEAFVCVNHASVPFLLLFAHDCVYANPGATISCGGGGGGGVRFQLRDPSSFFYLRALYQGLPLYEMLLLFYCSLWYLREKTCGKERTREGWGGKFRIYFLRWKTSEINEKSKLSYVSLSLWGAQFLCCYLSWMDEKNLKIT